MQQSSARVVGAWWGAVQQKQQQQHKQQQVQWNAGSTGALASCGMLLRNAAAALWIGECVQPCCSSWRLQRKLFSKLSQQRQMHSHGAAAHGGMWPWPLVATSADTLAANQQYGCSCGSAGNRLARHKAQPSEDASELQCGWPRAIQRLE